MKSRWWSERIFALGLTALTGSVLLDADSLRAGSKSKNGPAGTISSRIASSTFDKDTTGQILPPDATPERLQPSQDDDTLQTWLQERRSQRQKQQETSSSEQVAPAAVKKSSIATAKEQESVSSAWLQARLSLAFSKMTFTKPDFLQAVLEPSPHMQGLVRLGEEKPAENSYYLGFRLANFNGILSTPDRVRRVSWLAYGPLFLIAWPSLQGRSAHFELAIGLAGASRWAEADQEAVPPPLRTRNFDGRGGGLILETSYRRSFAQQLDGILGVGIQSDFGSLLNFVTIGVNMWIPKP